MGFFTAKPVPRCVPVPRIIAGVATFAFSVPEQVPQIMALPTPLPAPPSPMHAWAGAHGNRLYGDSWGDPFAPPVVLLHGGGQTRHTWRHTAYRLARAGYHAVAYDARGHGDSTWVENGDYSDAAMAQDLACVVRTLDKPPVLIGASMGGMASLEAVGSGVVEAAALILADVAHRTAKEGVERVRDFMARHTKGFVSLAAAADAIAEYRGLEMAAGHMSGLAKNLRIGAEERLYWHWDPRFLEGRNDLAERSQRLGQHVRRLCLPTLLARGEHSDVLTPEVVQEFLAMCPSAKHIEVSGAGHMLTGDNNDAFGDAAIAFIRQVGA